MNERLSFTIEVLPMVVKKIWSLKVTDPVNFFCYPYCMQSSSRNGGQWCVEWQIWDNLPGNIQFAYPYVIQFNTHMCYFAVVDIFCSVFSCCHYAVVGLLGGFFFVLFGIHHFWSYFPRAYQTVWEHVLDVAWA